MIKDSGDRTHFESGAVRDLRVGKGRCDLLPLDIVETYMDDEIIGWIWRFQTNNDLGCLYHALDTFRNDHFRCKADMLLEVAVQFEEGAAKYGDSNWQKGIPVRCYIDSALRHYLKFLRGDTDEPHDRAFCWNILCGIWTCVHKPELNDYRKEEETMPVMDSKSGETVNNVDRCVICGDIIPEGSHVCHKCLNEGWAPLK